MKIIWSPKALNDVKLVADIIAEDKPKAAQKWIKSIFKVVEKLEPFPESGRIVEEVQRNDIREIILKNYRIIYRVSSSVDILIVKHGARLLSEQDLSELL
jgi:toxin ParE1/3/4